MSWSMAPHVSHHRRCWLTALGGADPPAVFWHSGLRIPRLAPFRVHSFVRSCRAVWVQFSN
eukprot:13854602-Alexandrium_andersonii.AAC.1